MFKKIKQLAGDSLIYGISSIITRFISIFLIPIYTKIFQPSDYGIINLVTTTFVLMGIFVVMGLDNSAALWYWDKEDEIERERTFSSWFWFQITVATCVGVVIIISSKLVSRLILNETGHNDLFIIAGLNLPLTTFSLVFNTWLRVKRKPVSAVAYSLFSSLLTIGLSIYLVIYLRMGLRGVFLSQLISNSACALVVIFQLRGLLKIRFFNLTRLGEMLKYAIPLIPATISFWLLNSAGSFFISHYASKTEVGLFQIGSSIAAVCNMVFWAFLQAWSPFAMSIHKHGDAKDIYATVFDLYCAMGGALVLFIFLFAPEILHVLTTKAYYQAALVAGLLSLNIFIANISQITCIGSSLAKTNMPYAIGVIISAVISVILYVVLIPLWGKEGAAISTLAGSAFLSCYVTFRAQKLYFVPYHISKNIKLVLSLFVLMMLSFFIKTYSEIAAMLLKSVLFLLFLAFIFLANRNIIINLLRKLKLQVKPI